MENQAFPVLTVTRKANMLSKCVNTSVLPHFLGPHGLFMKFSRQKYWSGCHVLLQGIRTSKFSKDDKLRYGLLQRTVDDLEKEENFI